MCTAGGRWWTRRLGAVGLCGLLLPLQGSHWAFLLGSPEASPESGRRDSWSGTRLSSRRKGSLATGSLGLCRRQGRRQLCVQATLGLVWGGVTEREPEAVSEPHLLGHVLARVPWAGHHFLEPEPSCLGQGLVVEQTCCEGHRLQLRLGVPPSVTSTGAVLAPLQMPPY